MVVMFRISIAAISPFSLWCMMVCPSFVGSPRVVFAYLNLMNRSPTSSP